MPIFTFYLSNGREVRVQGPNRDDAAATALRSYPEVAIVGERIDADPEIVSDEAIGTDTTDTTGEEE